MIEVKNLIKSFNEKYVLKDLSFNIYAGNICGIMGKNGAGKSTLLKIIFGELEFDSGFVTIDNKNPKAFKRENFSRVYFLNDSPHVYDYLTPLEYVQFFLESKGVNFSEDRHRRFLELGKIFEIGDVCDQIIKNFSFGMRRKVQLLSLIMLEPKLLFLDEPTLGLDAPSVVTFKRTLAALASNGATIIVSSHEPDFLKSICDQLLILHEGRIAYAKDGVKQMQDDLNFIYMNIIDAHLDDKIQALLGRPTSQ